MRLADGTRLGPYEIHAPIGAGGMGEVYRARDTRLDRTVALKVLSAESLADPDRKRRFLQEARAASALNHPNIVTIYDIGSEGGRDFIAMEYVAGQPLGEIIGSGGLELRRAAGLAVQIAAGLAAAHAAGITHRDVKPANLMVTEDGLVKILDFGLAKLAERPPASELTRTFDHPAPTMAGALLGTAAYMSPEQAEGGRVDARSDIFSFGAVLYEMVTGRRAFGGGSVVGTLAAVLRATPEPPGRLRQGLPEDLGQLIARCLRKDPAARFQSMAEVKAALEGARLERTGQARASIAVLPFTNLSPDKENEYFSDGLAEEILNALTQLPGLRVIARASAFAFRGREHAIGEIAEKLRVESILQGSVRRAGNRVRVTAQLIHVADESQLWSERYDRALSDVFAIQDEIAQAIVGKLKVQLRGEPGQPLVKRYTQNPEAHSLYLKGVFHLSRLTGEELEKGRRYLEQAVAVEPGHAAAWVQLAGYHIARCFVAAGVPRQEWPKAREAALKAAAADESLAEAQAALGVVEGFCDLRWPESLNRFQTGMRLNPASALTHFWQSNVLWAVGRVEESLAAMHHALEHDPLSPLTLMTIAALHNWNGQYGEAVERAQQALEIDPNYGMGMATLGEACCCLGRFEEGIGWLERARRSLPGEYWPTGYLGAAYVRAGRRGDAERLLAEMEEKSQGQYISAAALAMVAAKLGQRDRAFAWLEAALEDRAPDFFLLIGEPHFAALRPDSRYQDLLRRANLACAK